jgi:signal peptidase II
VLKAVNRYVFVLGTGLIWLVLDQLTKGIVASHIALNHGLSVIPGFLDIVHILNRGAAFGFLNNSDTQWQFWLFFVAALLVGGLILYMVRTSEYSLPLFWGLGSILGGAAGNLVDRIRSRAVTDFLDIYWGQWHWPAFNVADIAICVGVFAAGLVLLQQARKEQKQKGK